MEKTPRSLESSGLQMESGTQTTLSRVQVKIRPEIVTLQTPELVPESERHRHLSPDEWNEALRQEDVVVIDTRNRYETEIGTFRGAIDRRSTSSVSFRNF